MDTLFGKFTKTKKEPENQNYEECKPKEEEPLNFKVVFVGDMSVGAKTSFVNRYVKNMFYEYTEPTIGAAFCVKPTVSRGRKVKLEIWDTNGQTRYIQNAARMYLKFAAGIVLGYDVTVRSSFEWLREYYIDPIKSVCPDAVVMVIGNKVDLVFEDGNRRGVSVEEGEELAREFGTNLFFEGKQTNILRLF